MTAVILISLTAIVVLSSVFSSKKKRYNPKSTIKNKIDFGNDD
jgi:hypothetical protein